MEKGNNGSTPTCSKSILEIAGEQIFGNESQVAIERETALRKESTLLMSLIECDLNISLVFQLMENLCLKLKEHGEEYFMVTANPFKQTSNYMGSTQGKLFMDDNKDVMDLFVKHCYNVISSSSTPTVLNKKLESNDSDKPRTHVGMKNLSSLLNKPQRSVEGGSFQQAEVNDFDSDVTELYDWEKTMEKCVLALEKDIKETTCKAKSRKDGHQEAKSGYPAEYNESTNKGLKKAQDVKFVSSSPSQKYTDQHLLNIPQRTVVEGSSGQPEINDFDSEVTELYDWEKTMEKCVLALDKDIKETTSGDKGETSNSSRNKNLEQGKKSQIYYPSRKRLKKFNALGDEIADEEKNESPEDENGDISTLPPKTYCKTKYPCADCSSSFLTRSQLVKHRMKSSNDSTKCGICNKMFSSSCAFKKHQEMHIGTKKCMQCSKSFKTNDSFKKHLKIHDTPKHECDQCNKKFFNLNTFKSHMKFHDNPKYKCGNCEQAFYLRSNLVNHKRKHCKKVVCKTCSVEFKTKGDLDHHSCGDNDSSCTEETLIMEDGKYMYVCNICRKKFDKRRGMLIHRKLHTIRTFSNICDICSKAFKTRNSLHKHKKIVHSQSRNFICDYCGKQFKQQETLNVHRRIHDENRFEYKCMECGKALSSEASLKTHLKLHLQLKPFMCDICGAAFAQRGNMAKHMLSHSNKHDFKCDKCGKQFKYHETLKTHLRAHALKEGKNDLELLAYGKVYPCDICGKKFPSSSQHVVHMRTHTDERPYPCSHCGKCFKESGKLKRHMKVHKTGEHEEHNYNSNDAKVEKSPKLGAITKVQMHHDFNIESNRMNFSAHPSSSNATSNNLQDLVVLNNDPAINHQVNNLIENMRYTAYAMTNDTDGKIGMMKTQINPVVNSMGRLPNEQIRVIDDNRHQFLMHQLTPAANLIMQAPERRQIQNPPSPPEIQVMQQVHVDFLENNGAEQQTFSLATTDNMQKSNQTHSMQSYTKFF